MDTAVNKICYTYSMDDLATRAKEVIAKNLFMVLSTTDGKTPWISPIFYAVDENYHFYWYSGKNSKHSGLIGNNPHIATVIFNSTDANEPGVYLEGWHARLLLKNYLTLWKFILPNNLLQILINRKP